MHWLFIDSTILSEEETGFTLRLNAGSWAKPLDITPDKTAISAHDQARLIRLGLAYAKEALVTRRLSEVS